MMKLFCENSEWVTVKLDSRQFVSRRNLFIMCTQMIYFESKKTEINKENYNENGKKSNMQMNVIQVCRGFCCNTFTGDFKQNIRTGRINTCSSNQ